jgi:hypothetical protein
VDISELSGMPEARGRPPVTLSCRYAAARHDQG